MRPYVVRQGDYLKKLAHTLGFKAEEVWAHPKNAQLRARRGQGHMLVAGDLLYVPERGARRPLGFDKGGANAYVAAVPTTTVRVRLAEGGAPLKNERYRIEGLGDPEERRTDADGVAELRVPVHLREVRLVLLDHDVSVRVGIGDLDPADERSGIEMRLTHLGHLAAAGADPGGRDASLRAAIRGFQAARGLPITGALDAATRDALVAAHGS